MAIPFIMGTCHKVHNFFRMVVTLMHSDNYVSMERHGWGNIKQCQCKTKPMNCNSP